MSGRYGQIMLLIITQFVAQTILFNNSKTNAYDFFFSKINYKNNFLPFFRFMKHEFSTWEVNGTTYIQESPSVLVQPVNFYFKLNT